MQTLIALLLNKINLVLVYPKLQKCILDHLYFQNKIVFANPQLTSIEPLNVSNLYCICMSLVDNKIHVIEHVISLPNSIFKMPQP